MDNHRQGRADNDALQDKAQEEVVGKVRGEDMK